MAEVRINYFDSHTDETRNRISDACFSVVGLAVYHRDPEPKDVSILPQFFPKRIGGRSPYFVEITVALDSVDWLPGLNGFSDDRELYNLLAEGILTALQPAVPSGKEFFVWVQGYVHGFAEGFGTFKP